VPSSLICTLNKSERPRVPGMLEAKYNVFSSGLNMDDKLYYCYQKEVRSH
jgi:hypothetical protein